MQAASKNCRWREKGKNPEPWQQDLGGVKVTPRHRAPGNLDARRCRWRVSRNRRQQLRLAGEENPRSNLGLEKYWRGCKNPRRCGLGADFPCTASTSVSREPAGCFRKGLPPNPEIVSLRLPTRQWHRAIP